MTLTHRLRVAPLALLVAGFMPTLSGAQTVDVVGGNTYGGGSAAIARGNAYEVTTSVTLVQAEFYLGFVGSRTLTFTVHSSPAEFGLYTQELQRTALVTGNGYGWYSLGPITQPLNAGTHYIIALSWNIPLLHHYNIADSQPVSFGSETHCYVGYVNPLPTSFYSAVNDQAVIYQRLTTFPPGGVPIVNYCTAGTTTNGCTAQITASAQPSLSFANGCSLSVSGVEGLKTGVIFYGIDNAGFTPTIWAPGSTSYRCVRYPAQRTPVQSSGGTFGLCDGSYVLDWNAYQQANSHSLGNPWGVGAKIYAQAWFRDPNAVKSTNLSDAIELTWAP